MENKTILIAGATGFIGKALISELVKSFKVKVLTRQKDLTNSDKEKFFYWNPDKKEIDLKALENVTHIINLCGAGIVDKRWTKERKQELLSSRVEPAKLLFSKIDLMPNLEQYITASGINCYDINKMDGNQQHLFVETDEMASDYVSLLVKSWEETADLFQGKCKVVKLRISFVISERAKGILQIEKLIKSGFGSVIGSGKQAMPWIHLSDLIRLFDYCIKQNLDGIYHAISGNTANNELTHLLAKKNQKIIFLPNVPAFILKLILGELSVLVLTGIKASNAKILYEGFTFNYKKIEDCF
ncbi:MAG: TIGR01777 family oxidoreductase [Bacteroidota bacterium]